MQRRTKRRGWWLFAGFALLTVIILIYRGRQGRQLTFDSARWIELSEERSKADPKNPRGLMVNDLIKRRLSLGMEKQEVRNLLGPPDDTSDDYDQYYIGARHHSGQLVNILPGYDYLALKFDEHKRLIRVEEQSSEAKTTVLLGH